MEEDVGPPGETAFQKAKRLAEERAEEAVGREEFIPHALLTPAELQAKAAATAAADAATDLADGLDGLLAEEEAEQADAEAAVEAVVVTADQATSEVAVKAAAAKQPVVDEVTAGKPVVDEPAANEPVAEEMAENLAAEKPGAEEPVTEDSGADAAVAAAVAQLVDLVCASATASGPLLEVAPTVAASEAHDQVERMVSSGLLSEAEAIAMRRVVLRHEPLVPADAKSEPFAQLSKMRAAGLITDAEMVQHETFCPLFSVVVFYHCQSLLVWAALIAVVV